MAKEEDASYPGVGEVVPMHANHLDICKFDDPEDDGYKQVRAKIKQAMEAAGITVSTQHQLGFAIQCIPLCMSSSSQRRKQPQSWPKSDSAYG